MAAAATSGRTAQQGAGDGTERKRGSWISLGLCAASARTVCGTCGSGGPKQLLYPFFACMHERGRNWRSLRPMVAVARYAGTTHMMRSITRWELTT